MTTLATNWIYDPKRYYSIYTSISFREVIPAQEIYQPNQDVKDVQGNLFYPLNLGND
jgi:hypothetical protein